MKREADIEKWLCREVRKRGALTYKWTSPGKSGVPDRIIVVNGRVWFVELKTEAGKLSALQKLEIANLKANGATVRVVYGPEGVRRLLCEMFDTFIDRVPPTKEAFGIEEWKADKKGIIR